jgi:ATP-dependent DNA helicase RecQ
MTQNEQKKSQIFELLNLHYGFSNFRPGQERAIDRVLEGKDTLVILPTGGGKSLCYQLPALVLHGLTIVVSPLIALMKDQVDSLNRIGIPAAFINSSQSLSESRQRLEEAKSGSIKLLYIAPERFYNQEFTDAIKDIKVDLFAIDEAHCISEWGHDFRPSYMKLKQVIEKLGSPAVLALTATATPEVRNDIIKQLGFKEYETVITGFARPNLQFGVIQANDNQKLKLLHNALMSAPEGPGIIYAGTRTKAVEIYRYLESKDIPVLVYHAGMDPQERREAQDDFMQGRYRVIVATNAFGLGIDKKNIRFVIHFDIPGTIEAYYQEAGRAGRDGKPSLCLLFFHPRDRYLREFFIKGDNPPPSLVIELYELLKSYESDKILVTYQELKNILGLDAPEMAVGTALKLLEGVGLIGRTHEKTGSGRLQFVSPLETLQNSISSRSKTKVEIFNKLISGFGEELYAGIEFNSEELANKLGFKKESLMRLINSLAEKGMLEYHPPFRGTEINMLKLVDKGEVNIDFDAMKKKLDRAYEKLDKMEQYAYHFDCRQKFILDYFGEERGALCGKCDNCLNEFQRKIEPVARTRTRTVKFKQPAVSDLDVDVEFSAKSALGTKLTQLETFELYKEGLSISEMAKQRGLKEDTIVSHLCYLLEKGMDVNIIKFVKPGTIKDITNAIKKNSDNKLKTIKESLDEEVGYNEIKLVIAGIKNKTKKV